MRRIIITALALTIAAGTASAQEHMKFKGVPIDGQLTAVRDSLMQRGFTVTPMTGKLNGLFAGNHVTLSMTTTPTSRTTTKVDADLDSHVSWEPVKNEYMTFKRNLLEKYGQYARCTESFTGAYREGDGYEMKAIINGKCTYTCEWSTPLGTILIAVMPDSAGCHLRVQYSDRKNSELYNTEQNDIYKEDL